MQQKVKYNILKDIITSITKFESYEEFAANRLKNTVLYTLKIIITCSILISIIYTIKLFSVINNISNEINKKIYDIYYEDGNISINSDNLTQINSDFINLNIIIDTTPNLEEIKKYEYINNLNKEKNNIILFREKYILQDIISKEIKEYNYQELKDNGFEFEKEYILSMFNGIKLYSICLVIFCMLLISVFVIYGINFLMYSVIFALIGNITSFILKVPLKFKATYNIATHALTLSTLLQTIYIGVNITIGLDIKYFQIMYLGITYIYIITAILMIKMELLKRKIELKQIIEEQEKVKKEKELEELNKKLEDKEICQKKIHKNENEEGD